MLEGVRVHSCWRAPRGALAAAGIAYSLRDRHFEWSTGLEKEHAILATFEPPAVLNASTLRAYSLSCDACTMLLKVEARAYGLTSTSGGAGSHSSLATFDNDSASGVWLGSEDGAAVRFAYYDPPTLITSHPRQGNASGGTRVTILGSGLAALEPSLNASEQANASSSMPHCRFGHVIVAASVVSDTAVRCVAPRGAGGSRAPLALSLNGVDFDAVISLSLIHI